MPDSQLTAPPITITVPVVPSREPVETRPPIPPTEEVPTPEVPGCHTLKGVEEIGSPAETFCSGLKRHPTKGKSGTVLSKNSVLSYANTSRSESSFTPQDETAQVLVDHKESTVIETPNWKTRQNVLASLLEENFGLRCRAEEQDPKVLTCQGGMEKDKLRLLGTFLSSSGNLDMLEESECIRPLLERAYRTAVRQQETKNITQLPMRPYEAAEWRRLCQRNQERMLREARQRREKP